MSNFLSNLPYFSALCIPGVWTEYNQEYNTVRIKKRYTRVVIGDTESYHSLSPCRLCVPFTPVRACVHEPSVHSTPGGAIKQWAAKVKIACRYHSSVTGGGGIARHADAIIRTVVVPRVTKEERRHRANNEVVSSDAY